MGCYKGSNTKTSLLSAWGCKKKFKIVKNIWEQGQNTSLMAAIASTTCFVNWPPFPDVPIKTVGLISWQRQENEILLFLCVDRQKKIKTEREISHINSVYKFGDRFMFVSPRLLEMLEWLFTRTNNQSLQKKFLCIIGNDNMLQPAQKQIKFLLPLNQQAKSSRGSLPLEYLSA